MIDPYNQVIWHNKKKVEFDKLPEEVKQNLLNLWKVKNPSKYLKPKENESKRKSKSKEASK